MHATLVKDMTFIPLNVLRTPREGTKVVMNRWWALDDRGYTMVYHKFAHQCNSNEEIARHISKKLYSGNVVFIERAYA
jgi:hypothetical protein